MRLSEAVVWFFDRLAQASSNQMTEVIGSVLAARNITATRHRQQAAVARLLSLSSVEAAQPPDIRAALRIAAEPEALIINHQFVILPAGP